MSVCAQGEPGTDGEPGNPGVMVSGKSLSAPLGGSKAEYW